MITYGFSVQGKSHIKRGTVCQDYNKVVDLGGRWYLGVVADGVGSAPRSDVGSRTATEALCDFCRRNIDSQMSDGQLENMMRQGYEYAWGEIVRYAQKENVVVDHLDTTLSAVLYNGEKVIYGHAGDGGILVRQYDGKIRPITKRQKGADGSSVIPLRGGNLSWDFGIYEEKVAAVLLATDGMLDGVFQPVLVNLPPDKDSLVRGNFSKDSAYITAAEFFMSPDSVYRNRKIKDPDGIIKKFIGGKLEGEDQEVFLKCILENYIKLLGKENAIQICRKISKYYYAVWALKEVMDDKSVVCLMNERKSVAPQDITYYYEPDWKWRQERYNALLYGKPMSENPGEDMSGGSYSQRDKGQKVEDDFENAPIKPGGEPDKGRLEMIGKGKIVVCASVIAVLLIVGIIVKVIDPSSDKGNQIAREETNSISDDRTFKPGSTKSSYFSASPAPTDGSGYKESELTENGEQKIREMVRKFVEILGNGECLEWSDNLIDEFREELGAHGLDEKLRRFLVDEHYTVKTNSSAEPSCSSSPLPGNKSKKSKNFTDLIGDIALLNGDEELKNFMEKFKNKYQSLQPVKRDKLCKNLESLLSDDDD